MSDTAVAGRRGRTGGGAARRAERTAVHIDKAPAITRAIPNFELLGDDVLATIEANAETVLEEIGVNFVNNPAALDRWREAGADVQGERVHIPRGLARKLCETAPSSFIQHARNPANSVEIGGKGLVLAPVYGPPFVRDAAGGRRYATMEDFRTFVKLGHMSKWLHHSGGTVCEPTDVPVNKRHLDMIHAHMTLTDKPFMGSVTEPSRAQDSVDMCKILFGEEFATTNTVMTSLININSPLTFDDTMMGALEVYAANMQATIISPFIVGGAMAPVSVMGTLTQVLAEVLAGIAYSQLVRPGAPVIFGAFVTSIDMNSGAPTFGTPEASQILYGAGQLARRMNLPPDRLVLHSISQHFKIDGHHRVLRPEGMGGAQLSHEMLILHGVRNRLNDAINMIDRNKIQVQDTAISGLCSALARLLSQSRPERHLCISEKGSAGADLPERPEPLGHQMSAAHGAAARAP